MSNDKQQTAVEWFLIECGKYGDMAQIPDEVIDQAEQMEFAGKEMSYAEGYSEGYKRALGLIKWNIENQLNKENEQR